MDNTLSFSIRKDKVSARGYAPVRATYSIKGDRIRLNTPAKFFVENWDANVQRGAYYSKEECKAKNIIFNNQMLKKEVETENKKIEKIINTITDIETAFRVKGFKYSIDDVKNAFRNIKTHNDPAKKQDSTESVLAVIDAFLSEHKTTLAEGSTFAYNSLKMHLEGYSNAKKEKLSYAAMNESFFLKFQNYLINDVGFANSTTAKTLTVLKRVIKYARKKGMEVSEEVSDVKITSTPLPIIALTENELEQLFYFDFFDKNKYVMYEGSKLFYSTLDKVRDLFCFMAETGLRYSDAQNVKRINIIGDTLTITTIKTKDRLRITLTDYAKAILQKHRENETPLPQISNQRFNKYLKEMCKEAELNASTEIISYKGRERVAERYAKYELITSHVARKTFVTLSLERGVPAEVVRKVSGHKSHKAFSRYVNVTDKAVENYTKKTRGTIDMTKYLKIAK